MTKNIKVLGICLLIMAAINLVSCSSDSSDSSDLNNPESLFKPNLLGNEIVTSNPSISISNVINITLPLDDGSEIKLKIFGNSTGTYERDAVFFDHKGAEINCSNYISVNGYFGSKATITNIDTLNHTISGHLQVRVYDHNNYSELLGGFGLEFENFSYNDAAEEFGYRIQLKTDGVLLKSNYVSGEYATYSGQFILNTRNNSPVMSITLKLNENNVLEPGMYHVEGAFSDNRIFFGYIDENTDLFTEYANEGVVQITDVSGGFVEGKFNYIVGPYTITEGKFRVQVSE